MNAAFPPLRQLKAEIADRGTVRLGEAPHHRGLPAVAAAQETADRGACGSARLHQRRLPGVAQPQAEIADRGTVRLGDGCITGGFPPLRQPKPETADRGTVRLGDGCITAGFPPLRQPKAEIADRGTVRLGERLHHGEFPLHR